MPRPWPAPPAGLGARGAPAGPCHEPRCRHGGGSPDCSDPSAFEGHTAGRDLNFVIRFVFVLFPTRQVGVVRFQEQPPRPTHPAYRGRQTPSCPGCPRWSRLLGRVPQEAGAAPRGRGSRFPRPRALAGARGGTAASATGLLGRVQGWEDRSPRFRWGSLEAKQLGL